MKNIYGNLGEQVTISLAISNMLDIALQEQAKEIFKRILNLPSAKETGIISVNSIKDLQKHLKGDDER